MSARFFADLNPAYPSKGQRRYRVFMRHGAQLDIVGASHNTRKAAERSASRLQVQHDLAELGFRLAKAEEQ